MIKNKLFIKNLELNTKNPLNANIFNIIFKKSLIKSGKVTCDLKIKGWADSPQILGDLDLKNVEVPSYSTFVEDLTVNFTPKHVILDAQTDYLNSDLDIVAIIRNNGFKHILFDNLEVYSRKTNLTKLLNSFNEISYSRPIQIVGQQAAATNELIPFDTKNITIEHGKVKIDEIIYNSLPINNFSSNLNVKKNQLKLTDTSLDIAGGKLTGDFGYNFDKAMVSINTKVQGVDANKMSEGVFEIKNQLYGKLDGETSMTTFGANDEERFKNLNGTLNFSINDGKMPKLGSLEYLLRAGNLIKSGISGLTLNNLTGLLIPVQTGDFEAIKGDLTVKNGVIENLKIYSKGENLSILITGNYDLVNSVADLYVLGKLSKHIDTLLGPIGNASLNSFFNLIPGVHLDEVKDTDLIKQINSIPELGLQSDKFRIFRAIVDGDIYSENFVSKFEWIDSKSEETMKITE